MMDDLTEDQRRKVMRRIKSKDTKPEVLLRKKLWHEGFRYRKNWKKLPGKPDIVLTRQKICIFIDGEYFHGKDWLSGRKDKVSAGSNPSYWVPKIEANMARDRAQEKELRSTGWTVLRFWSRDVLKDPESCIASIKNAVRTASK